MKLSCLAAASLVKVSISGYTAFCLDSLARLGSLSKDVVAKSRSKLTDRRKLRETQTREM